MFQRKINSFLLNKIAICRRNKIFFIKNRDKCSWSPPPGNYNYFNRISIKKSPENLKKKSTYGNPNPSFSLIKKILGKIPFHTTNNKKLNFLLSLLTGKIKNIPWKLHFLKCFTIRSGDSHIPIKFPELIVLVKQKEKLCGKSFWFEHAAETWLFWGICDNC